MSNEVLRRSKLICYFDIAPELSKEVNELYRPEVLPLSVFHFHYPALYFPALFAHFKIYLPPGSTHSNLRLRHEDR
jgi:hypothetical protein